MTSKKGVMTVSADSVGLWCVCEARDCARYALSVVKPAMSGCSCTNGPIIVMLPPPPPPPTLLPDCDSSHLEFLLIAVCTASTSLYTTCAQPASKCVVTPSVLSATSDTEDEDTPRSDNDTNRLIIIHARSGSFLLSCPLLLLKKSQKTW